MMPKGSRTQGLLYLVCAGLLVLTVAGCVVYSLRDQILVHYNAWRYVNAPNPDEELGEWLAQRQILSLPILASYLRQEDSGICRNAGAFISEVIDRHPDPTDPEHVHLALLIASRLHEMYPTYSHFGREQAVGVAYQLLGKHLATWSPNVPTALETAGGVILLALQDKVDGVREQTLRKLTDVWSWRGNDEVVRSVVEGWKRTCYEHAVTQLRSSNPEIRAAAAAGLARAPFHEGDLALIELIDDPDCTVKRTVFESLTASLADSLGPTTKMKLVEYLHHEDATLCEAANVLLQASGVRKSVVELAKLVKHPLPSERSRVVTMAFEVEGIDPIRWVLALRDDPSPEVRMEVARVAATSDDEELKSVLKDYASADDERAVRELAKYLLKDHLSLDPNPTKGIEK
ncbi:hypothetical protein Pan216_47800 [Planctomycetes bacterium Pan216]|uniref:HEAT repeat protein n=2 Tax=Kolteria novifilia TaxID=2527975 RepID=A0A518BA99_9BACT|nr:hypothetical protein Pan216_47800 [Planctomycetes bacterium Pan216]